MYSSYDILSQNNRVSLKRQGFGRVRENFILILREPYNLYSLSYRGSIVLLNGWAELIPCIGVIKNSYTFKPRNLKGRNLLVHRKHILKLRTHV